MNTDYFLDILATVAIIENRTDNFKAENHLIFLTISPCSTAPGKISGIVHAHRIFITNIPITKKRIIRIRSLINLIIYNFIDMLSILILIIVFVLIAMRRISNINIEIWKAMLSGAFLDMVLLQVSLTDSLKYIDWDVMIFLFCMFVIGAGLEASGYIENIQ